LLKLEEQQLFTHYYIDKALAEKRLDDADKTLAAYSGAQTALSNVDIQVTYYYNGAQFAFVFAELGATQKILFSIDDPEPKTETGHNAAGYVNMLIQPMVLPVGEHTIPRANTCCTFRPLRPTGRRRNWCNFRLR